MDEIYNDKLFTPLVGAYLHDLTNQAHHFSSNLYMLEKQVEKYATTKEERTSFSDIMDIASSLVDLVNDLAAKYRAKKARRISKNVILKGRKGLQEFQKAVAVFEDDKRLRKNRTFNDLISGIKQVSGRMDFYLRIMDHSHKASFDVIQAVEHCLQHLFYSNGRLTKQILLNSQNGKIEVSGKEGLFVHVIVSVLLNATTRPHHSKEVAQSSTVIDIYEKSSRVLIMFNVKGWGEAMEKDGDIFSPGLDVRLERSGMGLAMAKSIIEQEFGGSMRVKKSNSRSIVIEVVLNCTT